MNSGVTFAAGRRGGREELLDAAFIWAWITSRRGRALFHQYATSSNALYSGWRIERRLSSEGSLVALRFLFIMGFGGAFLGAQRLIAIDVMRMLALVVGLILAHGGLLKAYKVAASQRGRYQTASRIVVGQALTRPGQSLPG